MTEQEAVERLKRIWTPGVVEYWHVVDTKFRAEISFEELSVVHLQNLQAYYYWIQLTGEEAALRCGGEREKITFHRFSIQGDQTVSEDTPAVIAFATQWMPYLRRNAWLSGLPLEASAHEKAEWIQGFSREEIEAWNLKM